MKNFIFLLFVSTCLISFVSAQNNVHRGVSKNSKLGDDRFEDKCNRALYSDATLREKYKFKKSNVDYNGFRELSDEVYEYRKGRLIGLEDFLDMLHEEGTIILDTRSKKLFDAAHMRVAIHLNFLDFTDEKLAEVIPSFDTRILI